MDQMIDEISKSKLRSRNLNRVLKGLRKEPSVASKNKTFLIDSYTIFSTKSLQKFAFWKRQKIVSFSAKLLVKGKFTTFLKSKFWP